MIEGQWRLRISAAAEHDQAQAVVLALVDKAMHHLLDRRQAIDLLAVGVSEVGGFHGLGNVDGQHQVTHRLLAFDGFFHEHRAGGRHQYQSPDQQIQQQLPSVAMGSRFTGCLTDRAAHGAEKWHAYGAMGSR